MHPRTETPPEDTPTNESRPLLQRVFGHTEPDRDEGQHQPEDAVDGRAADQAPPGEQTQPEDQVRPEDETPGDETRPDDHWDADEQAADPEAVDNERWDGTARHDEQLDDVVADDVPHSESRMDGEGDFRRVDDTDAPHGDPEPTSLDDPTDLKPGDAPAAAVTEIWSEDSARDFHDRWREAQLSFVDDPQKATDDMRTLVDEAVEALTASLARQREQLSSWPDNSDTEQYRMVVQRYRTFFERLLAL